jgi:hypothetical protein
MVVQPVLLWQDSVSTAEQPQECSMTVPARDAARQPGS